ncbi:MAG: molybdenum cofactor guanylyltransferase [Xanthomonadales bacterium]|nr:molybdenum cofactor guanylyltransferase [Xanthomonadales bacterium]
MPSIAGILLAGGRSSRMIGRNKIFVSLDGRQLIQHVIDRIRPQVGVLALSVETPSAALEALGLLQLPDPQSGHHGPLGGLLSALRHFGHSHDWVLVVPCDAPFLPLDLAAKLHNRAIEADTPCAGVVYAGVPQPTFSIWHHSLLPDLERAIGQGALSGFKQFMRTIRAAECPWPLAEPPPFFNVNDQVALDQASCWVQSRRESAQSCSV